MYTIKKRLQLKNYVSIAISFWTRPLSSIQSIWNNLLPRLTAGVYFPWIHWLSMLIKIISDLAVDVLVSVAAHRGTQRTTRAAFSQEHAFLWIICHRLVLCSRQKTGHLLWPSDFKPFDVTVEPEKQQQQKQQQQQQKEEEKATQQAKANCFICCIKRLCLAAITKLKTKQKQNKQKRKKKKKKKWIIAYIYFTHQSFQHAIMPFLIPVRGSPTVTGFATCFFLPVHASQCLLTLNCI